MYTGQTLCYSFVGKGNLGLERVARYPSTYLLYVVDIEIYLSCSILEGIRDPGTESTLDHIGLMLKFIGLNSITVITQPYLN